jgi:hypothetical protein
MNLPTCFAVTALGLIFGANVFAQTTTPELTRAEVQAQLVQAQAEGFLPMPKNDYPPSPATIARNKALYAIKHQNDTGSARTSSAGSAGSAGSAMTSN